MLRLRHSEGQTLSSRSPEQGPHSGSGALKMSGEGERLNKNPYTLFLKVTPSFLGHKSIC